MAWNFDGTTGYLGAAQAAVSAAPLTMVCWFRKTAAAADYHELVSIHNPSTGHALNITAGSGMGAQVTAFASDGGWDLAITSTTFTNGQWHHAAGVFVANNERQAYLNGGGKGTSVVSAAPVGVNHTDLAHGAYSLFAGDIAEAAIWNVALTDEEIAVLAKGFSPLCLWHRLPNLVVYQDLMRPLNRPGIGPAMTAVGGTNIADHPRMIYPTCHPLGGLHRVLFAVPYRLAAAAARAGRVTQGWAALVGAEQGTTCPLGEVSS
jgi:hypothetical protein